MFRVKGGNSYVLYPHQPLTQDVFQPVSEQSDSHDGSSLIISGSTVASGFPVKKLRRPGGNILIL
ncbi:hypothetical protein E2C01_053870 [Portunus trituberculatus]|uniref:Uncharacterized protein n=1 Tax=Portunus trituberculatus TaxID=210409 RepID=A0A5B7GLH8_PORTR|nr:hypothetical protein [Portunus trituberculatus]